VEEELSSLKIKREKFWLMPKLFEFKLESRCAFLTNISYNPNQNNSEVNSKIK
jgi:hypothetical protein